MTAQRPSRAGRTGPNQAAGWNNGDREAYHRRHGERYALLRRLAHQKITSGHWTVENFDVVRIRERGPWRATEQVPDGIRLWGGTFYEALAAIADLLDTRRERGAEPTDT